MQTMYTSGPAPNPNLARYVVQSSDVISDLRVNVCEEKSQTVMWYKERFLTDDEIVEQIVHNPTSTICWIVHRPKRGWYIRMRAPSFPSGTYIPLLPVSQSSSHYTDGALSLSCRTDVPPPRYSGVSSPTDIELSIHSYPPTPPSIPIMVSPPSPTSINARLHELSAQTTNSSAPKPSSRNPPTQIAQFILAPHSSPHVPRPENPEQSSLLTKALSLFKNHKPSHSSSFTVCPLPPEISSSPMTGNASQSGHHRLSQLVPTLPTPFITFHDRTPIYTFRSVTGLLEIDRAEERIMGIETSFWIAVALTYLEFLEDRESYLAAVND